MTLFIAGYMSGMLITLAAMCFGRGVKQANLTVEG